MKGKRDAENFCLDIYHFMCSVAGCGDTDYLCAGFMVLAAPVFGVIAAVLWGVEITKTNRDQK